MALIYKFQEGNKLKLQSDNTSVVNKKFPKSLAEAKLEGKKSIEAEARIQAEQLVARKNAEAKEAKYQKDLKEGNVPWYQKKVSVVNNTPEEKIGIHGELAKLQTVKNQRSTQEKLDDAALEVMTSIVPELPLLKYVKPAAKVVKKIDLNKTNFSKLETPTKFEIQDILGKIKNLDNKNSKIIKHGSQYFKELNNPESLKRLKEFGNEYGIDLSDAYKKAEQRWDYGTNIGKHSNFQVKKTDEGWYGLSTTNASFEDKLQRFVLYDKFGSDSKQLKEFEKKLSQEKSINYISDAVPLDRYEKTVWHELSHDINKSIIEDSPKLKEDIKNIFIDKNTADLNKVKEAREYVAKDLTVKKDRILSELNDNNRLKEISKEEFDYVTKPTETWAFLSTNLRQDLKNTGIIKDYNELLTIEKLDQAIKNKNTTFTRFEPYIKDKEAFIKLFNKMTLGVAAITGINSLNNSKAKSVQEKRKGGLIYKPH